VSVTWSDVTEELLASGGLTPEVRDRLLGEARRRYEWLQRGLNHVPTYDQLVADAVRNATLTTIREEAGMSETATVTEETVRRGEEMAADASDEFEKHLIDKVLKAPKAEERKNDPFVFSAFAPPVLVALVNNPKMAKFARQLVEINFDGRLPAGMEISSAALDEYFRDEANWSPKMRGRFLPSSAGQHGILTAELYMHALRYDFQWRGLICPGYETGDTRQASVNGRPLAVPPAPPTPARAVSPPILIADGIRYHPSTGRVTGTVTVRARRRVTRTYYEYLSTRGDFNVPVDDILDRDDVDDVVDIVTDCALEDARDIGDWDCDDEGDTIESDYDSTEDESITDEDQDSLRDSLEEALDQLRSLLDENDDDDDDDE